MQSWVMSHPTTCCCIQSTVLQIILEWMNGKKKKKEKIIFRGRSIWTALLGSWDFWLLVFSKKKKKKKRRNILFCRPLQKTRPLRKSRNVLCILCSLHGPPHVLSITFSYVPRDSFIILFLSFGAEYSTLASTSLSQSR